jgi:2-polyprenyl-6-methoxyphenol hydroxylase-like FAD-dependent oxidoreductase
MKFDVDVVTVGGGAIGMKFGLSFRRNGFVLK